MQGSYISRRSFIGIAGMSALAVAGFGLAGCSGSNGGSAESGNAASGKKALSGTITAVGSTALQPLCEAAAEQFMQENPGVQITVQGGGSGQGITDRAGRRANRQLRRVRRVQAEGFLRHLQDRR